MAAGEEAARLDKEAEASAATVATNIQRSSNYVLSVVLYTIVLLFAGMAGKMSSRRLRIGVVVAAYVVLIAAVAWVLTFPVSRRGLTGSPETDEALRAQRGPSWARDRRSPGMENVPAVPWGKVAAIGGTLLGIALTIKGVSVLVSMASQEARYRLQSGQLRGRR